MGNSYLAPEGCPRGERVRFRAGPLSISCPWMLSVEEAQEEGPPRRCETRPSPPKSASGRWSVNIEPRCSSSTCLPSCGSTSSRFCWRETMQTGLAACPRGTSDKVYRRKGRTTGQVWGIWHSRGRDATFLVPSSERHTSRHGCIEIWCRYDNPGKGQEMSVKNKNRSMKVPTN